MGAGVLQYVEGRNIISILFYIMLHSRISYQLSYNFNLRRNNDSPKVMFYNVVCRNAPVSINFVNTVQLIKYTIRSIVCEASCH